jgi:hypothetical protein
MDNRFENEPMSQEASRLLNNYLQCVCMPDGAIISTQEQDELREEMSEHILALAAAHQELGSSAEDSMRAALKQFGEAKLIGQAVAREIGKRPSILGSPHTVSMIGGILVNWATLCGANYLLANTGIGVFSPEGHLLGLVVGCVTGSVVWKRRKSIRQATLWNARFCAGATTTSIAAVFLSCLLLSSNRGNFFSLEWLRLAVPALVQWITVAGIAGACSGALTGLWCRFVRHCMADKRVAAFAGKGPIPFR